MNRLALGFVLLLVAAGCSESAGPTDPLAGPAQVWIATFEPGSSKPVANSVIEIRREETADSQVLLTVRTDHTGIAYFNLPKGEVHWAKILPPAGYRFSFYSGPVQLRAPMGVTVHLVPQS